MKPILFLTLVVTMLPGPRFSAQKSSRDESIRFTLPVGVEAGSCRVQYAIVGPFGGYGGFIRHTLSASEFEIETVHEGTAVEGLKAVISCSGYHLETVTLDSAAVSSRRTIHLDLQSLGTIPFLGLVRGFRSSP